MHIRIRNISYGATYWRYMLLAAAVAAAQGCTAWELRQAQDAFNRGAALDNVHRVNELFGLEKDEVLANPRVNVNGTDGSDGASTTDESGQQASSTYYRDALTRLQKIDGQKLNQDGLLVTKLTLEALCHSRLGDYDRALSIAEAASKHEHVSETQRDQVILTLLPGLVKNDQAVNKYTNAELDDAQTLTDVEDLLFGDRGAARDAERARSLAKSHSVELYVLQVQLALYKNLRDARFFISGSVLTEDEMTAVRALITELGQVLEQQGIEGTQRQAWIEKWRALMGMT